MTDPSLPMTGRRRHPSTRLQAGVGYAIKRMIDVLGAAVLLALVAPVLAVCAVAIVAETGRPVFYRGVRLGRGQLPFRMWKLRSMIADADDELHHKRIADAMAGEPAGADECNTRRTRAISSSMTKGLVI